MSILVTGMNEALAMLRSVDAESRSALSKAINAVADETHDLAVQKIMSQVALSASYVKSRLYISQRASVDDPTAVISGRVRSTQLRRYQGKQLYVRAKMPGKKRLAGTSVKVKAGGATKVLKHAWVMKLKYGDIDAKMGRTHGIVQRTGSGRNDYRVLYGPSVDQVWNDVKDDVRPLIEPRLAVEFLKQLGITS